MNISPVNVALNPFDRNLEVDSLENSSDILQRLKKISSGAFFKQEAALESHLNEVSPLELTKILNCLFEEVIREDLIKDPALFLDRLADIVPLSKLEESVKADIPDALQEAQRMFEEAKLYLQMTEGNTSLDIKACARAALEGITSALDSIIVAFGIGEFFKSPKNEMDADFKSQKITMLLSLFGMITSMVLPALGSAAGGAIIGGILLCISVLSVVWPFIKPRTLYLPSNAENWTRQVQQGSLVAHGRKESLDEIANILKMNRHAILVGPSRVGKSLTAKAFAEAVERGDYPELSGKAVFRINTTDIIGQTASFLGGGNTTLNEISAAMGRHRNDIILVFDEIHMACKNEEKIADQLKTFLDEAGEFPHVIGITTEDEYENHVKNNNAFSLRFDRVNIENTSADETMKILCDTVLRSRLKPIVDDDALNYIYDKSCKVKEAPQPATALKLLKRCINQTGKTQRSPTDKKIVEISNKILLSRSLSAASRGRRKEMVAGEMDELNRQLSAFKEEFSKESKELDGLFKAKGLLDFVTKETYSSVLKISDCREKTLGLKNEKQLKLFLLLQEFLGRSLEAHIKDKSKELGVKVVINKDLVDEVALA